MNTTRQVIPYRIPAIGGWVEGVLLRLTSDSLVGLGEAPAVRASLEQLVGELSSDRPIHPAARCAQQTAQLDILAKRQGKRLVDLLGGAQRGSLDCSALVLADSPIALMRQAEARRKQGFTTFKLKSAGFPYDLERLGALRQAVGWESRLRLDYNGRADPKQLSELRPFHLELVEQPLPEDSQSAEWLELIANSGLPLAVDESLSKSEDWADSGLILAAKLATVGGPQATLEILDKARGKVLLGSSYETSVGIAAALAVGCALKRPPLACGLATRQLLEADLASGLAEDGPQLQLPKGPGLGVELNWSLIERYRLDR